MNHIVPIRIDIDIYTDAQDADEAARKAVAAINYISIMTGATAKIRAIELRGDSYDNYSEIH